MATYEYDNQYQLTKETYYTYSGTDTNPATTTVCNYTYDTAGNILRVDRNGDTVDYTYSDANWDDLLTEYNGVTINYDASGNPTNWYNGTTYSNLTWVQGRQLESLTKNGSTYTYAYDMSGIRSSKTVDGVTHNYITQNGKVVRESYGSVVMEFIYSADDKPFALNYSTDSGSTFSTYYYLLNLQGDVVGLYDIELDSSGNILGSGIIARYTYDAWGRILNVTNDTGTAITSSTHIANVNPLRYRGYYYDAETGFYYLQSRYYDPIVGRFINADGYASTGQGFIWQNMFKRCPHGQDRRYRKL